jgi:hypothetical protein
MYSGTVFEISLKHLAYRAMIDNNPAQKFICFKQSYLIQHFTPINNK